MLKPFAFHEPNSVAEACHLLSEYGEDASIYAGGTELLLAMKEGFLAKRHLIGIKDIDIAEVTWDEERRSLNVGAGVTHRALECSTLVRTHLPVLSDLESQIANVRVRNMGTIGGNICFNEPHADPATLLVLLRAQIHLSNGSVEREVESGRFFVEPVVTEVGEGELVARITLPIPVSNTGVSYLRFGFLERPLIGVGALLEIDDDEMVQADVCVGAIGPRPERFSGAELGLQGAKAYEPDNTQAFRQAAEEVARVVEVEEDTYGSAEYKRHLVTILVARALDEAFGRARGQSIDQRQ
jgi:carbon-monoxide dehydrogenase medium subunit